MGHPSAGTGMACLSVENGDHHRYVLQEMTGLWGLEALTDLTIHCGQGQGSGGGVIHAHTRVLQNVSAVVRKTSVSSSLTSDRRLHLIMPDFSVATVKRVLDLLYTGQARKLAPKELDKVNDCFRALGVSLDGTVTSVSLENGKKVRKSLAAGGGTKSLVKIGTDSSKRPITQMLTHASRPAAAAAADKAGQQGPKKYCLCREGESPGMIGCDYCDEWYHSKCLNLTKADVQGLAGRDWQCPNCELRSAQSKRKKAGETSNIEPEVAPPAAAEAAVKVSPKKVKPPPPSPKKSEPAPMPPQPTIPDCPESRVLCKDLTKDKSFGWRRQKQDVEPSPWVRKATTKLCPKSKKVSQEQTSVLAPCSPKPAEKTQLVKSRASNKRPRSSSGEGNHSAAAAAAKRSKNSPSPSDAIVSPKILKKRPPPPAAKPQQPQRSEGCSSEEEVPLKRNKKKMGGPKSRRKPEPASAGKQEDSGEDLKGPNSKTPAAAADSTGGDRNKFDADMEQLFFCYTCKSIYVTADAKKKHEVEVHGGGSK